MIKQKNLRVITQQGKFMKTLRVFLQIPQQFDKMHYGKPIKMGIFYGFVKGLTDINFLLKIKQKTHLVSKFLPI